MRARQSEPRVAFAPNGALLTSAQQGNTLLWNARTGHVERRFTIGGQPAVSPDGTSVAIAVNAPDLATATSKIAMLTLGTGHYRYLPASVHRFPAADELAAIMHRAGLRRVRYRRLSGGAVVAATVGVRPDSPRAARVRRFRPRKRASRCPRPRR